MPFRRMEELGNQTINDSYLIYDNNNESDERIFIFATDECLRYLICNSRTGPGIFIIAIFVCYKTKVTRRMRIFLI